MENKRLKIGIFVDVFFPMIDGVAVVVDNYAKRLCQWADVTVFCPKSRDKKYIDNFPYKVVRSLKLSIPKTDYDISLPALDLIFDKNLIDSKLDIVHIHSPFTIGQIGIGYAKINQIPVIATIHSQYKRDFYERTKSKLIANIGINNIIRIFNLCDEIWPVNRAILNLYQGFGINKLMYVHRNATDLMPVNLDKDDELIKKYDIQATDNVLLFVGRIDPIKNIFFTLQALEYLTTLRSNYKMLFVGSGPAIEELKTKIKEKHLEKQIIVVGRIEDRIMLARHYKLADLFIFPSLYDASSLVQIEAASQKTPAVFIKGAATADTITDKVNGFLGENNPIEFGKLIHNILSDSKLLSYVSEHAYKDLYLSWDNALTDVYNRYLELVEMNKNR